MRVAEERISAVFCGTYHATIAVRTLAKAVPQAETLASSTRCLFLQLFL